MPPPPNVSCKFPQELVEWPQQLGLSAQKDCLNAVEKLAKRDFLPRPDTILYISPLFSPVPFLLCVLPLLLLAHSGATLLATDLVTITRINYAHLLSDSFTPAHPTPCRHFTGVISQFCSVTGHLVTTLKQLLFKDLFGNAGQQSHEPHSLKLHLSDQRKLSFRTPTKFR